MTDRPSRKDVDTDRLSGGTAAGDGDADDAKDATGQELRQRRETLGADLSEIAESLHIRIEYLKALENSDYDALPGSAYAVGFVRSYAKHLGMDSDKAALQFKMEIAGERPAVRLDFPQPITESRIPTGAIVLVTVLLAMAIYGLWFYLNARDLNFADIIPKVPSQFGAETKQAAQPVASGEKAKTTSPTVGEAPKPAAMSPPRGATGQKVSDPEGAANTADAPAPPDTPSVAGSPVSQPETAAVETGSGRQAGPGDGPGEPPPADTALPAEKVVAAVRLPPPPPEVTVVIPEDRMAPSGPPASVTEAPAPRKLRVELRAVADSWIQVKTAAGALLVSRILARGKSYKVPGEEGLRLTTGNAGGLQILVDGVPIPSLGPFGAVRRDVVLDPDRLKADSAPAR